MYILQIVVLGHIYSSHVVFSYFNPFFPLSLFIHSKNVKSISYVAGTILSAGNTAVNEIERVLVSGNLYIQNVSGAVERYKYK